VAENQVRDVAAFVLDNFTQVATTYACVGEQSRKLYSRSNPTLVVMDKGGTDDNVFVPATSVTIHGVDAVRRLRDACNHILKFDDE